MFYSLIIPVADWDYLNTGFTYQIVFYDTVHALTSRLCPSGFLYVIKLESKLASENEILVF